MKSTALVLSVAAFLSAWPVCAQEVSDDIVDATVGEWLIASADGSPGCKVKLEKEKTIGGRALTEEKPCGAPWHDEIAAWDFTDGGVVFRDATRKALITFEEQEGGPWRTPLDVSPSVYFVQAPGGMDHVPTEKEVVGEWVLKDKKGKPLCGMSFLDTKAEGNEDAKGLSLAKDCSAAVRKTKAAAWQISDIQLVVIGGEDWVYTLLPDSSNGFTSDDGKFRLEKK